VLPAASVNSLPEAPCCNVPLAVHRKLDITEHKIMANWFPTMNVVLACLIGALLGWLVYQMRYQNRQLVNQPRRHRWPYILGGTLVGLFVIVMAPRSGWTLPDWDWILVGLLGGTVGIGELLSRYRDAPIKALLSPPATAYVLLNAAAAVLALVLGRHFEFLSDQREPIAWAQVLSAGLGAMVVLRSSVFQIRVGDGQDRQDVAVGPSSFLQSLLDAADRAVDRLRAQERAWAVASMMQNVSTAKALDLLPPYLSALMQNLNPDEESNFDERIQKLRDGPGGAELKAHRLGLIAMNYMGEGVLRAAIESLPIKLREAAEETSSEAVKAGQVARDTKTVTEVAAAAVAKVVDATQANTASPEIAQAAAVAQDLAAAADEAATRSVVQADKVVDSAEVTEAIAVQIERGVRQQSPSALGLEKAAPLLNGSDDRKRLPEETTKQTSEGTTVVKTKAHTR
jgi:hypothetical protein